MIALPMRSTLFPYTTLFRSLRTPFDEPAEGRGECRDRVELTLVVVLGPDELAEVRQRGPQPDRKSTRLNSSHITISYAVFCLKKKIFKIRMLCNSLTTFSYS